MIELPVLPLSKEGFAHFGEVIETGGARHFTINDGTSERFHDLARIDVADGSGHPLISIFRATPRPVPIEIRLMERHPLGTQAFMPLSAQPFLVVVARARDTVARESLVAFLVPRGTGISYAKNVWHHPVLALNEVSDFLVVDRGGAGDNLEEFHLDDGIIVKP